MDERKRIREQIKHMRSKDVEPYTVLMCPELYESIGFPKSALGIRFERDIYMTKGFEVR